jgi:acetolactate synthase-1/2/3 large subunit
MADGYARATGRVGVCIATSGPGATNLMTGLATAYMDSTPIVAITGQVPTSLLGRDGFQEADVQGISLPCTKHNYLITDIKDLPMAIKEAFYIASTGRPGPVLIDVCKDVQQATMPFTYPESIYLPGYNPNQNAPSAASITRAAKLLNEADRPVIVAGQGVSIAHAEKVNYVSLPRKRISPLPPACWASAHSPPPTHCRSAGAVCMAKHIAITPCRNVM